MAVSFIGPEDPQREHFASRATASGRLHRTTLTSTWSRSGTSPSTPLLYISRSSLHRAARVPGLPEAFGTDIASVTVSLEVRANGGRRVTSLLDPLVGRRHRLRRELATAAVRRAEKTKRRRARDPRAQRPLATAPGASGRRERARIPRPAALGPPPSASSRRRHGRPEGGAVRGRDRPDRHPSPQRGQGAVHDRRRTGRRQVGHREGTGHRPFRPRPVHGAERAAEARGPLVRDVHERRPGRDDRVHGGDCGHDRQGRLRGRDPEPSLSSTCTGR